MALIHYEGLKTHQHIHKNFRERTLPALEKELERTGYSEGIGPPFSQRVRRLADWTYIARG